MFREPRLKNYRQSHFISNLSDAVVDDRFSRTVDSASPLSSFLCQRSVPLPCVRCMCFWRICSLFTVCKSLVARSAADGTARLPMIVFWSRVLCLCLFWYYWSWTRRRCFVVISYARCLIFALVAARFIGNVELITSNSCLWPLLLLFLVYTLTNSIIGIETPFVGMDHLIVVIIDPTVGRTGRIGCHC